MTTLRASRRALGDGDPGTAGYLVSVLRAREQAALTDLLGALAILGAPEASGLVRRCLGSTDPDIRAQAIEALESLGIPDSRGASPPSSTRIRPGHAAHPTVTRCWRGWRMMRMRGCVAWRWHAWRMER